jgi:hypothetical protein
MKRYKCDDYSEMLNYWISIYRLFKHLYVDAVAEELTKEFMREKGLRT